MSGQWPYPGQFPSQITEAQWQQQQSVVAGAGGVGPGGPIQMGGAQGMGPRLPQGMGVAQGMQGMGVAQFGYAGMPYQPVNSMTGVNMYYQQQPFYPGAPPTGAPPTREDQLRLYEEQRMREKEEIKRREAEERKRRDFEEQKRRLQSMNVLNPKVGGAGAVAMETLIGFTPSPKSKPKATPTTTPPIITAEQAPPPLTAIMAPPTPPVSIKTATTINTTSGPSIDELLSNTMSGLGESNQRPLTKSDFKSTPPIRGLETKPSPSPANKTYSASTKAAKVWEKGGEELSGLFKTETSGGMNEASFSPGSDDGFGDFQSVTSNTATSNTVTGTSVLPSAGGRERVGGGGIRRALPLMTSPAVGSPVLVHYQSGGPPVMATTSQSPSLPSWLMSPTVELPHVYKEVYKRCCIDGSQFTNTGSLFPLLISSDLDRSVLHDLWSAVNLTSPGQLTQTELYQLLGLIGLAQNRQNVKVALHDLLMTPSPPVPTLAAINIINTNNEDDFCEFKASPLVPHKFDGAGSVGVASVPPTTQPATDPSDPYSALRQLAPPTNNDPSTQDLQTIKKKPVTQQQQQQQQIDQQRHHDQQHQILHQQQQQPTANTDVQLRTDDDGWADFTSFPDTNKPLATPSTDTTSSNIINMMSPSPVAVIGGGMGPVAGGVSPAGTSDGLIWSDDEFTEFSTYQSQDVLQVEPVLSSPSHTIGGGGGGRGGEGGIVSPSPTSPMSSTSTDSNKSLSLSQIWCQCLQKCLDLLNESQSLLTSSVNDEETLNVLINEREGQMKIKGLAELYRFAKRLHTSSRGQGKSLMSHSKSETLTELMLNIRKKWNEIRGLFDQEKIDKILNTSSNSFFTGTTPKEGGGGDKERCVLCLQPSHIFISPLVTIDGCSEDYQLATGFVSGRLFHVQCANFYKNCLSLDFEQIP